MAWADCPIDSFPTSFPIKRLTGLALGKSLTVPELNQALSQAPVDVRAAYVTAGEVRGTWTRPEAQSAAETPKELTTFHQATVEDGMVWIRRNVIPVIKAKNLTQFSSSATTEAQLVQRIEDSMSLRDGLRELVKQHQAWQDIQAVAQNERGFITGLQVVGTPGEVFKFAQLVGANAFTLDRNSLPYMRPLDPPDLLERMASLPKDISSRELLHLSQAALRDFEPYL